MRNIKLTIEYDGTCYSGWQRQVDNVSIQQTIEEGLQKLTGQQIPIIGSGRTDSGVHARGQVANFFTDSSIPSERFSYALNTTLPPDIRILDSEEVSPRFHAQFSAVAKKYRYSIILHPHGTAIGRNYYYNIRDRLDIDFMGQAIKSFEGTHDFSAFRSIGSPTKTAVRTIYQADIIWEQPYLYFDISGNGFLYNMVRIIVGTLIEVGRKRIPPHGIQDIIWSKNRKLAGPTAPGQGLCLEKVYYEETEQSFT